MSKKTKNREYDSNMDSEDEQKMTKIKQQTSKDNDSSDENEQIEMIQCNRNKHFAPISDFNKDKNGQYYKRCKKHQEQAQKYKQTEIIKGSNKCQHDKRKSRCITCKKTGKGGSELCDAHYKLKNQCVDCKGSSICKHKKRRLNCVPCKGANTCQTHKISDKRSCVQCLVELELKLEDLSLESSESKSSEPKSSEPESSEPEDSEPESE